MLDSGTYDKQLKKLIDRYYEAFQPAENPFSAKIEQRMLKSIMLRIKQHGQAPVMQTEKLHAHKRRWLPYAAALLVFALSIGLYLSVFNNRWETDKLGQSDIAPGGNKAMLILADGTTVHLSTSESGIVVKDDGVTYTDGTSILKNDEWPMTSSPDENVPPVYATLTTPRGGQYRITLPDGSNVWLNAASTLRYPLRFDHSERIVELTGEAYFEVRNIENLDVPEPNSPPQNPHAATRGVNHIPFLVKTENQVVEVLGTQFNISAYTEDLEIKTTLLEGVIRVEKEETKESLLLAPGEQSTLGNGRFTKSAVDTQPFSSWKSGIFHFNNTSLENVMKQLARWYDVEIKYTEAVDKGELYGGTISRDTPLSKVLYMLQAVGDVQFEIKGKQIILQ